MKFYVGQAFVSKRVALEYLLGFGKVMLHLDARKPAVEVPPHLKHQPNLALNLSYRFNIPDLQITDAAAQASLSFQGQRFFCVLPFSAIFALSIDQTATYLWLPEVPPELRDHYRARHLEDPDHVPNHVLEGLPAPKAPSLKVIRNDSPQEAPAPASAQEALASAQEAPPAPAPAAAPAPSGPVVANIPALTPLHPAPAPALAPVLTTVTTVTTAAPPSASSAPSAPTDDPPEPPEPPASPEPRRFGHLRVVK